MTLPDYIATHLNEPFEWGRNDCVLFAIGWLQLATGRKYLDAFPTWKNERQARRIVKELGGLAAEVDRHLAPINPHLARDGDIALCRNALGIFSGAHIVGPGPDGLAFINRMEAESAWSAT